MKLKIEYPNFIEGLMLVIGDKSPYCVSNDKSKFAYQIPLTNFKRGFDFYELNKAKDGSVYFTLVSMVGFKTICETNSSYHYNDMSIVDWQKEIFDIVCKHFSKEEYLALKKGYIKSARAINQKTSSVDSKEIDLEYSKRKNDISDENFEPFNKELEYLKNKPIEQWSNVDKFMKSSDDFLKLSMELNQKKKSGCIVMFVFLVIALSISSIIL